MDIKVRDLKQTDAIKNSDKLMVLVDDELNLVKNITKEEFLTNVISKVENNALIQEVDGNLYVNTSEIKDNVIALDNKFTDEIGDLDELTTEVKNNLVSAINEAAQSGSNGGGLEVGDIGIALYVNESKGLRRRLNGSQLPINANTQGFLNKLKAIAVANPSLLAESQAEWDAIKNNSIEGQCGKFFINEEEGYIQLARVVKLQGCLNLANIGDIVDAGIPDHSHEVDFSRGDNDAQSGVTFDLSTNEVKTTTITTTLASESSSLYKDDFNNVQEEAVQYPYFIQIATGQETEVNITNEIELANPYTLLESKYSEKPLHNACWLISNGQWNSGAVYVAVWEALLVEYNTEIEAGTTVTLPSGKSYTKRGLSVKASTEDYNDYDFVINTTDETFRLPLLNGSENLVDYSNGKDISSLLTTTTPYVVDRNSYIRCSLGAGTSLECTVDGNTVLFILGTPNNATITDDCFVKAGDTIVTVGRSGPYCYVYEYPCFSKGSLYFYIGETEQNTNLVDIGRIQEQLAYKFDKKNINAYITEIYQSGYSYYRIWSDGWCEQGGLSPTVPGNGGATITFLKIFKDTNYIPFFTNIHYSAGQPAAPEVKEVDSMIIDFQSASIVGQVYWKAEGYLAEGEY